MQLRVRVHCLSNTTGLLRKRLLPGLVVLMAISPLTAQAFEWKNFWSTAEQRAKRQLNNEQFDELVANAPDESWRGVGQYRQGDYQSASESFAKQHDEAMERGANAEAILANYNRANAEVLNENYESAVSLYDDVLASEPDHPSALHNRAIAERLLEQQQQQQQQQQESQQGEQGEEQQDQDSGQSESQEPNDQQEQNGDQTSNSESKSQSDQNSHEGEQSSEQQSEQAEQAAAERAMEAEQQQGGPDENNNPQQSGEGTTEPMTEREQANEQWLRQIPDDPAGLLQRKLENRHMTDYPTVKDSAKPW